jgi:transcriptional regulator
LSIYIPRHFAGDDAQAREVIAKHPFAALVTAAADGVQVTHLPLLLQGGALVGHMARPNPHWQRFGQGETVAIFQGPHAFVSRAWYADAAGNVPTWNYAMVHVTGRPEVLGAEATLAAVTDLSARFEPPCLPPVDAGYRDRLLAGIVAFRLPLARVEVKVKMSQNKPATDRAGVVAGLRAAGDAESLAAAQWMEAHERA